MTLRLNNARPEKESLDWRRARRCHQLAATASTGTVAPVHASMGMRNGPSPWKGSWGRLLPARAWGLKPEAHIDFRRRDLFQTFVSEPFFNTRPLA
jgi:hypothetical protein